MEVGDFPFLESIFMIFGKITGVSPVKITSESYFQQESPKIPKIPKIVLSEDPLY